MPAFYNFRENGVDYSFDDIFVPADVFREGNLWLWGIGLSLGAQVNPGGSFSTPLTTFAGGSNWKQISNGNLHLAAIKTDGTLWTWGNATSGRLGNNTSIPSFQQTVASTPVTTFAGGTNWKQVSCGFNHTAAVKTDGTLWIWGTNSNGQLGLNDSSQRDTPVTTFAGGTNWKQVSSGGYYTSAIKTDGTLWIWGSNFLGKLGDNTTSQKITPITTFAGGTDWKQVSCGSVHTAAIKTDGTLWTWGYGGTGQLGGVIGNSISTPVTTFVGGTNWKQVSVGSEHTSAIKTDGTLWVWGNGINGRLGNASTVNVSTPITTFAGGTNWKQVSAGDQHSAAVKTDGTLWTWGNSNNGRLGNASTVNVSTPITTFAGGTNWKQVSAGNQHSAAVTYNDSVI